MKITEVRIFRKENVDKKLKAFATITFDDCFVVRDVKVIEGNKGLFVAMPSRRMKDPCQKCGHRNVIRSRYCNNCGVSLSENKEQSGDSASRQNEHRDIAHPITLDCREYIQKMVLDEFQKQMGSSEEIQVDDGNDIPDSASNLAHPDDF